MDKNLFFFNGRSALRAGLILLKLNKYDEVLIPQFICDTALDPYRDLNIKIIFYKVDINLKPIWTDIKKKYNKKTKAIMMIHYFGFPNEISRFLNFKKQKKIFLIEDYCHGYIGKYRNLELGKIGDFSFSSLKKIFPETVSGGVLRINNSKIQNLKLIKKFNQSKNDIYFFEIYKKFKYLKNKFQILFPFINNNKKYVMYQSRNNFKKNDYSYGDNSSFKYLLTKNFKIEKKKRVENYKKLKKNLKKHKIYPFFNHKIEKLFPWYFVIKANENNRKNIFEKLTSMGLKAFSWPELPRATEKNHLNKRIWNSLICVNLNNGK